MDLLGEILNLRDTQDGKTGHPAPRCRLRNRRLLRFGSFAPNNQLNASIVLQRADRATTSRTMNVTLGQGRVEAIQECFQRPWSPASRFKIGVDRGNSCLWLGLLVDVTQWLEQARKQAGRAVNALMTATYWRIGERIFEQEQRGGERAGYGERIVEQLARDLSARFGRGFSRANVFQMRQFYLAYRARVQTASGLLGAAGIVQTLSGQFEVPLLCGLSLRTRRTKFRERTGFKDKRV
jgi:hypothetical protein